MLKYVEKIVPNLKENPSRQESDTFRKLIKQKEFQELDEFQLVKPKEQDYMES